MKTRQKPELISFSEFLMIAPFADIGAFFQPESVFKKGGMDALMQSGLLSDNEDNRLIEIIGSTAMIKIEGPMRPGRGWFYSAGYGDIQDAIDQIKSDSRIKTVIQVIDTPGGTVKGAFETEEKFRELAKVKTLISYVSGSATSGGALLTFPAEKRYLGTKTAQTGSIGVVSQHIDNRIWYKEFMGEIRTSVAQGDLKDAGTDTRGFDAKAKEVFDSAVGQLYNIFIDSAAMGLNLPRENIIDQRSAVFIGAEGIEQGLADGFMTLDELIEQSKIKSVFSPPVNPAFQTHSEDKSMDINKLKAEHPALYNEVFALGEVAGNKTGKAEGETLGIASERKRATEIRAMALKSQKDLAEELVESGVSADDARGRFLDSLRAAEAKTQGDIEKDIANPIKGDALEMKDDPDKEKVSDPVKEYEAAVEKARDGGKISDGNAMKAVKGSNPKLHAAYIKAVNSKEKGE